MKAKLLIILFFIPLFTIGQDMRLEKIVEIQNDTLKSKNARVDLNGNPTAIIVFSFTNPIKELLIKGNVIKQGQANESLYIINVPDGTKKLTLQHEDYYPFVLDFKENDLRVQGGHIYKVLIDNKKEKNTIQSSGSQYLVFMFDNEVEYVKVNGIEWERNTTRGHWGYKKMVPLGTYQYEVKSKDGIIIHDKVEVKNKNFSTVVRLSFNK